MNIVGMILLALLTTPSKTIYGQNAENSDCTGAGVLSNLGLEYRVDTESEAFSGIKKRIFNCDTSIAVQKDTVIKPIEIQPVDVFKRISKNPFLMGLENVIESSTLEKAPSFLGERDVIRILQLMPGVSLGSEGSNELHVRGGSADQNLIMIDGVPLYNSSHLFGMYSSFNPLVISSAQLYTGGFPAQFGGKTSSIVDVRTREPDINETHASVEVGLTTIKGIVELPIVKDKATAMLAVRRSLLDALSLLNSSQNKEYFNFYDLNAALNYQTNENNLLKISVYLEGDGFTYRTGGRDMEKDGLQKAQKAISIGWKYLMGKKTVGQLLATYNYYSNRLFEQRQRQEPENSYSNNFQSRIAAGSIKYIQQHYLSHRFKLDAGVEYRRHFTDPSRFYGENAGIAFQQRTLSKGYMSEISGFGQLSLSGPNTSFDIGLRYNIFNSANVTQSVIEPRIVVKQNLSDDLIVKLTFARVNQPIQRLLNPGLGMPMEIIFPADDVAKPQSSEILTAGISKEILAEENLSLEFSAEAYVKNMENIISFKDGFDTRSVIYHSIGGVYRTSTVHDMLLPNGVGKAKGLEVSIRGHINKFSGWANYTISRVRNRFTELNEAEWFDAQQDRRHIFNTAMMYQINQRWSLSATWSYSTGSPVNIPVSYYRFSPPGVDNSFSDFSDYVFSYGKRNSSRMIPFHKLDVNLTKAVSVFKMPSLLSFGVYNLYNRQNPSFYYLGTNESDRASPEIKSLSIFPILPSISLQMIIR